VLSDLPQPTSISGGLLKVTGELEIENTAIASLEDAGTITQIGGSTGNVLIDAGDAYTLAANVASGDSMGGGGNAVTNNGTWVVDNSLQFQDYITGQFTNSGTLTLESGAQLILPGGSATLAGTIGGGGSLTVAEAATIETLTATAASIDMTGGSVNQTGNLSLSSTTTLSFSPLQSFFSYSIAAGVSIDGGTFINNGTFAETGGAGASAVATSFTNTGNVSVGSGETLSFSGASNSMGGSLGGFGTGAGAIAFAGGTTTLTASVYVA
jgi:hypothetical protein